MLMFRVRRRSALAGTAAGHAPSAGRPAPSRRAEDHDTHAGWRQRRRLRSGVQRGEFAELVEQRVRMVTVQSRVGVLPG